MAHYNFSTIGRAIVWFYQEHGYIDISDTYEDELVEVIMKAYEEHLREEEQEGRHRHGRN